MNNFFSNFDRLDLIIKYLYFKNIEKSNYLKVYYEDLYKRHIINRNGAKEKNLSPDSKPKNNINDFIEQSKSIYKNIKEKGFSKNYLVKMDKNNLLVDGSHRLSCSLSLGIEPFIEKVEKGIVWGIKDLSKFTKKHELHDIIYHWCIMNKNNINIVLLFEPSIEYEKEVINFIEKNTNSKNIYSFEKLLNEDTLPNFLINVYGKEKSFHNIFKKVEKLLNNYFFKFKILLFQGDENCLVKINEIKSKVRDYFTNKKFSKNDFITMHSASSKTELENLISIFYGYNNNKYNDIISFVDKKYMFEYLETTKNILNNMKINHDDICIVGSTPLDILGIRKTTDIDFICKSNLRKKFGKGFLKLHKDVDIVCEKYSRSDSNLFSFNDDEIIDYPLLNFNILGLKMCDLNIIYERKKWQKRKKDLDDVEKIEKKLKGYLL